MDWTTILPVIEKGLTLIPILVEGGQEIITVINNLKTLTSAAQTGTVTEEQVDAIETDLDAKLAEFNQPME